MYYVIINPRSKSGQGMKIWTQIEPVFKRHNVDYQAILTKYAGHATELVHMICENRQNNHFIVLGGDGTLNEVVNGFTELSKTTLSYIPTGSSNDFARSMKLPKNYETILEHLLNKENQKELNIGLITDSEGNSRRFMVSCGIGYDAAVCHETFHSAIKKYLNMLRLGKITYLAIALKQIFRNQGCAGTLTTNRGDIIPFSNIIFSSGQNHKYEGGGFMFCPEAEPSDDVINVCLCDNIPKLKILSCLPLALIGKHTKIKGITLLECENYIIELREKLPTHVDGECFHITDKIKVQLLTDKITYIY